jgi:hypothetical protein
MTHAVLAILFVVGCAWIASVSDGRTLRHSVRLAFGLAVGIVVLQLVTLAL